MREVLISPSNSFARLSIFPTISNYSFECLMCCSLGPSMSLQCYPPFTWFMAWYPTDSPSHPCSPMLRSILISWRHLIIVLLDFIEHMALPSPFDLLFIYITVGCVVERILTLIRLICTFFFNPLLQSLGLMFHSGLFAWTKPFLITHASIRARLVWLILASFVVWLL